MTASLPNNIKTLITPRPGDIGGYTVLRALPSEKQRMVGPFIFWDQMGPGAFGPGQGLDVRPHPHIGLSTVTYLFSGAMAHKDSLGNDLVIRPGDVNLMTAGRGIVHSERSDPASRAAQSELYGIQSWLALPKHLIDTDPAFDHYPAQSLPKRMADGVTLTVIMGEISGLSSPVKAPWPTLYGDVQMAADACFHVDTRYQERALYVLEGSLEMDGARLDAGQLVVLQAARDISVTAQTSSRFMLLGGAPMDGPRLLWWNFVATSKAALLAAADRWEQNQFDPVPGDEEDHIPLPDKVVLHRIKDL